MPTIFDTVTRPDGTPVRGVEVRLRLIASLTDPASPGYVTGDPNREILGPKYTRTDSTGYFEIPDVLPNSDSSLSPGGTVYELRYKHPNRETSTRIIVVPDSPGPLWVGALIGELPGSLPDSALDIHELVTLGAGAHGGIPGIQDEIDAAVAVETARAEGAESSTVAASQPRDADLTTIAGLDSSQAGVVASDGAGWFRKTYSALKTALGLTKSDVGLGNVDNVSDSNKPVSTAQAAAIAAETSRAEAAEALLQPLSEKGQPSGYAGLDGSGKVPTTQIPALAISDTFVVASQAAMLALSAERGDVAVRTDIHESFILATDGPTVLAHWQLLESPPDSVLSVDGRSGTVSLADRYDAAGASAAHAALSPAHGDTETAQTAEANAVSHADSGDAALNAKIAVIGVPVVGMSTAAGFDNGAVVAAAVASLPKHPVWNTPVGTLIVPDGTYEFHSTIGDIGWMCSILGPGQEHCIWNQYFDGDLLRASNPNTPPAQGNDGWLGPTQTRWGTHVVNGITFDGTNVPTNGCGLHVGSSEAARVGEDLLFRHYNQGRLTSTSSNGNTDASQASKGVWVDCGLGAFWIEKLKLDVSVADCTIGVYASGAADGSHRSLGYGDWSINCWQNPWQDVLCVDLGASIYHGALKIRGNIAGPVPGVGQGQGAVIRIQGFRPATTTYSQIAQMHCDVQVEGENYQTIAFGTIGATPCNDFSGYGMLSFFGSPIVQSNWTLTGLQSTQNSTFRFFGIIEGATVLGKYAGTGVAYIAGASAGSLGVYDSSLGALDFGSGDYFDIGPLTADVALTFTNIISTGGAGPPQRKVIRVKQAASGSPHAVTWPASVRWGGFTSGVPPVQNQALGSADVYVLHTVDGQQWWGQQITQQPPGVTTILDLLAPSFVLAAPGAVVANESDEVSLLGGGWTLPAVPLAGTAYEFSFFGLWGCKATSGVLNLRLRVGGVTVATINLGTQGTARSAVGWHVSGKITFTGPSPTNCRGSALFRFDGPATTGLAVASAASSVTTSPAPVVDLTAQWATADPANTIQAMNGSIAMVASGS